jgi:hypothetical protein
MKLFLAALTIWSLPVLGISCGSTSVQEPARPTPEPELALTVPADVSVTLTNEKPTRAFAVYPDLNDPPTRLEVSVTKVVNPALKPITIFVYLIPVKEKTDAPPHKVALGSFSLYPADRPAKFMLDPVPALRKASENKETANTKEWMLTLELEKHTGQEPSQIEVTVSQPLWKRDKG